jgi:uncharacterized membrane protein YedE/YeeE
MRFIKYAIIGMLFGITMYKSEALSWFRIYEMFKFQSFHMYGIIGTAVITGIGVVRLFKNDKIRGFKKIKVIFIDKKLSFTRYLLGGLIFGLGWGMGGACPGPIFVLIGSGYSIFIVFMLSAMLGTFLYGILRHKLPH